MRQPRGGARQVQSEARLDLLPLVAAAQPAEFSIQVLKCDQATLTDWMSGLSRQQLTQLCEGLTALVTDALRPLFGAEDNEEATPELDETAVDAVMQLLRCVIHNLHSHGL